MVEYTHQVYHKISQDHSTTHFYHQPTHCVYNLENVLVNDNWEPDGKFWDIRPIHLELENK